MLIARLSIAFVQGFVLYYLLALHHAKSGFFAEWQIVLPLMLVFGFVPIIINLGLTTIKPRGLVLWAASCALVLTIVGLHYVARITWPPSISPGQSLYDIFPSSVSLATCIALFIAQALITAGSTEQKIIASYPAYFDAAWKLAVQIFLATVFTITFWLVLHLGSFLFKVIGISAFEDIIGDNWFSFPATTIVIGGAIYVTDVRPSIIRGIRTLKLTLFAWLLPIATLIAAGFLIAWLVKSPTPSEPSRYGHAHYAAAIFMGVAATLIYFLNAAYQDGAGERTENRFLQRTGQVAALLLPCLVLLALYGIIIRIQLQGFTSHRIFMLAAIVIGIQYAVGYAVAVFDRRWMKGIEGTNIVTAFSFLVIYLLLFTPLADPARLSANSQLARLGSLSRWHNDLDLYYLKEDEAKYGRDALKALGDAGDEAAKRDYERTQPPPTPRIHTPEEMKNSFVVFPATASIPDSFWNQDWLKIPMLQYIDCAKYGGKCEAFVVPVASNSPARILLLNQMAINVNLFQQNNDGSWQAMGNFIFNSNTGIYWNKALEKGEYSFAPYDYPVLQIGNQQFPLINNTNPVNTPTVPGQIPALIDPTPYIVRPGQPKLGKPLETPKTNPPVGTPIDADKL